MFTIDKLLIKKSLLLCSLVLGLGFWQSQPVQAASFSFTPSSATVKQGCVEQVDIFLDTQGVASNAADAVVLFDPSQVEIVDQNDALSGTQIKNGELYAVYPGNIVDNSQGRIMLTAFSIFGSYTGSGRFGTIFFKAKDGVTNVTFNFEYTPGASADSNIVDLTSSDVLSSVNIANFNVSSEPCVPDLQAPFVSNISPVGGSENVPLNTNISFLLGDSQSGVDLNTVQVQVYDRIYDLNSLELTLSGTSAQYSVLIDPQEDFPAETEITMVISAADLVGNVMVPRVLSYNRPVPPPPPPPEPVCGNGVVEEGEDCEPPGVGTCNSICLIDLNLCVAPVEDSVQVLEDELAEEEGEEEGEDDESFFQSVIESIFGGEELEGETSSSGIPGEGEGIVSRESLVGGLTYKEIVRLVTQKTAPILKEIGCTENCVNIILGNHPNYPYVPDLALLVLVLVILLIAALVWKAVTNEPPKKKKKKKKGWYR